MRRRLLASTLTIAVAIVVLFGVPLGVVLDRAVHADASSRLQREATRVARELNRNAEATPPRLPTASDLEHLVPAGDRVAVIFPNGRVVANKRHIGDSIAAGAPGPESSQIRVETPSDPIDARVQRSLLALVILGITALAAAFGLALIQSRRLANPLARLARSATRLGEGDFSLSTPRSGVPEIDEIATALDRGAARVAELLRSERRFSEHASHQLRSALTGLQLRIEELAGSDDPAVRDEAEAALEQSARLTSIIQELFALARTGRAGIATDFDLNSLVRQHVDDITPVLARDGRSATVNSNGPVPVHATLGAIGQVLDILLSNAARHGAGRVTATVSHEDGRARVDIEDEGTGIPESRRESVFIEHSDESGHGIGLALAHILATTEGGTITLVQASPPVFRVELPLG